MKSVYTVYRLREGHMTRMGDIISTIPLDDDVIETQARKNIEDPDLSGPAIVSTDDIVITQSWDVMPPGFFRLPAINPAERRRKALA